MFGREDSSPSSDAMSVMRDEISPTEGGRGTSSGSCVVVGVEGVGSVASDESPGTVMVSISSRHPGSFYRAASLLMVLQYNSDNREIVRILDEARAARLGKGMADGRWSNKGATSEPPRGTRMQPISGTRTVDREGVCERL